MANRESLDVRLRRRLGITDYGSWSAMPDRWLIVFIALFGMMQCTWGVLVVMVTPDLIGLAKALSRLTPLTLWQMPAQLAAALVCTAIALVGVWGLGHWAMFMSKGLLSIMSKRHFGGSTAH